MKIKSDKPTHHLYNIAINKNVGTDKTQIHDQNMCAY